MRASVDAHTPRVQKRSPLRARSPPRDAFRRNDRTAMLEQRSKTHCGERHRPEAVGQAPRFASIMCGTPISRPIRPAMSVSKGVHVEARSAGVSTAVRADHSTDRPHSTEPGSVPERALAEVLATILRVDRVSVDGHFFNDLGADSLVMAQFCAR